MTAYFYDSFDGDGPLNGRVPPVTQAGLPWDAPAWVNTQGGQMVPDTGYDDAKGYLYKDVGSFGPFPYPIILEQEFVASGMINSSGCVAELRTYAYNTSGNGAVASIQNWDDVNCFVRLYVTGMGAMGGVYNGPPFFLAPGTTHTLKLRFNETSVEAYFDGVLQISASGQPTLMQSPSYIEVDGSRSVLEGGGVTKINWFIAGPEGAAPPSITPEFWTSFVSSREEP